MGEMNWKNLEIRKVPSINPLQRLPIESNG